MIKLDQAIKDTLHYKNGTRLISFRYDLLNYEEVKIGELTAVEGRLGLNSLAQIKRKGNFRFLEEEAKDVDWVNDKIRPVMVVAGVHEMPLGVLMLSSPTRKLETGRVYRDVGAYDTSLVLLEDKIDKRYKIPKGSSYISVITQLINGAGIWKVNIPHMDAQLRTDREFEVGTSKLEIVNTLLSEINYTSVWVDAAGYFRAHPYVLPNERQPEYEYRNDGMSVIIPDTVLEEADFFDVPNKWIVVASNPESDPISSVYTNANSASPASTINRKRTIVDFRQVDDIASKALLDEYTKRIAYEASNVYGHFVFNTALMPHHEYMDCLYCEHDKLGIKDKYIETAWEMDLKSGGVMSHRCRRVISI